MTPSTSCPSHASELPSMIATLDSYASMFGPYHVQTLTLTVQIARALRSDGHIGSAQHLLEYSAKHLTRYGDQATSIRLQALDTLRDLWMEQGDSEKALAVQKEIVECVTRLAGPDDAEVASRKAELTRMLMSTQSHIAAA